MENKNEIQFGRNMRLPDVYTDSGAEYILPDYNGDVRKLLFTSATPKQAGRFVGDGEVEYTGIVAYNVVYLDGENNLSSTAFTSEYELAVKCPTDELSESYVDTRVANFAVRLLGPRKISAKVSLATTPHICTRHTHSVEGDAFSGDFLPKTLTRVANLRESCVSETVEREYAESIARLDGAIADEVSVIFADAEPTVEAESVADGEITVRGHIDLFAMIKNGDEAAYREERKIPFELSVGVPEGSDAQFITPELNVASLTTAVSADDSGVDVVGNLILEMRVLCDSVKPTEFVADAYVIDAKTENVYTDLPYNELISVRNATENHSFEFPRNTDELSSVREIIFLDATPRLESVSHENTELCVNGNMRITGVASTVAEDGTLSYAPLKLEAPFTQRISIGEDPVAGESAEVRILAHTPRASIDSARIAVTVPTEVVATLSADKSLRVLERSEIVDADIEKPSSSTVTVYYPTVGDSLFEIAKRYRTTPEKLAKDNAITAEVGAFGDPSSLSSVKRLVIY